MTTARCNGLLPIALVLLPISLIGVAGCSEQSPRGPARSQIVAEGVILSVRYDLGDGTTGRIDRFRNGGEGISIRDARGRLTNEYLTITYPQEHRASRGPHLIPAHRLVEVKFVDGGIESGSETPSDE